MHDITGSNQGDGRSKYMLQWLDAHASGPVVDDEIPVGGEDDQGFAGRLYQLCFRTLQDFYRQERDQGSSSSRSAILRECVGRLYLWGEPFGVGELDKALRQSDEMRDNVLERLGHIGKLALRGLVARIPPSQALHPPSKQIRELESIIKQEKLIIYGEEDETSRDGHVGDEEYDSGTEGLSDSGSYDIIEDIGFTTTCLSELGPSLAQNLRHAEQGRDQQSRLTGLTFSVSGPAMIYVSLVREKFKQAHYKLVERLGEANWQRHKSVREKMDDTEQSPEATTKLARESGIACSVFRPYSEFHDSGIGTTVPAQTEYAQSHTSFQSSNTEGEQLSQRVPKEPPEVSAGKPFQCFLCRCIISNVRNRVDWKMHVFADLRPYICTFSDCKDELAQFTTRAEWADHEFSKHRIDQAWQCPECSEKFACASDWEQHLQEMHQRVFTGSQLHVARATAYETHPRLAQAEECPLCRVVLGKPRRAFVKHVGRHMEEIALIAVPRNTEEDSDESSISTDHNSLGSQKAEILAVDGDTISTIPREMPLPGPSTFYTASANSNEDWTKVPDLDERRRIQNRIAQRNYRKKLKRRLEDLERRAGSSSASQEQSRAELEPIDQKRQSSRGNDQTDNRSTNDTTNQQGMTASQSEEDVIRCVCGYQDFPGPLVLSSNSAKGRTKADPDPIALMAGTFSIQCDRCQVWQHGGCVGITAEAMTPKGYFCERCRNDLHNIMTTVNGRRYSLYFPVQDLLGTATEHKGIIHPDQYLALSNSEGFYPSVTSDPNTLGAVGTMKTPRSPKQSPLSFQDLEDHTNLSPIENAVKDREREQASHSEPSDHTIPSPLKWLNSTYADYVDDNPADLYRPDPVDGTLAPQITSGGRSEGRFSSKKDIESPEATGRSSDSMIAETNGSKCEYDNDSYDLDVTPTGTPTTSIQRCTYCSQEFKGSPRDVKSKKWRHLRECSGYKWNAGLKCPLPECLTRHPMRTDNMTPHLLNFHKISSASERERILDDCLLMHDFKKS